MTTAAVTRGCNLFNNFGTFLSTQKYHIGTFLRRESDGMALFVLLGLIIYQLTAGGRKKKYDTSYGTGPTRLF